LKSIAVVKAFRRGCYFTGGKNERVGYWMDRTQRKFGRSGAGGCE
jgi:hypothetical protein